MQQPISSAPRIALVPQKGQESGPLSTSGVVAVEQRQPYPQSSPMMQAAPPPPPSSRQIVHASPQPRLPDLSERDGNKENDTQLMQRPANVPVTIEEPKEEPKAEPKPPSKLWANTKKVFKLLAAAAIAAGAYKAYNVYELRQPYQWSGAVEARTVSVGSRVGGRVKSISVREGQKVKAGDPIVVLEAGDLEAQRMLAQSEVDAASAALEKLSNGATQAEVAAAMARVATANANLAQQAGHNAFVDNEFRRTDNLFKQGALSQVERDQAMGQSKSGHGQLAIVAAQAQEQRAQLKLLLSGTRPEDWRAGQAQLAAAKAKLAQVESQIAELTVKAPNDARVEAIAVRPGDLLRPDARAVTLLERGELYVKIYVPETRLGKIAIGQEVPVLVDSFPNKTFKGRVEHINEVGEFTPRRLVTTEDRADEVFAARIALLEGEDQLRAGMAAFINIKK